MSNTTINWYQPWYYGNASQAWDAAEVAIETETPNTITTLTLWPFVGLVPGPDAERWICSLDIGAGDGRTVRPFLPPFFASSYDEAIEAIEMTVNNIARGARTAHKKIAHM
ncbi:hypothetical protein GCM10011491_34800 [Brucella endophytica]|uniref:Uncharacterized protein n=1 Tax=Brucella endophytica TaxID=1963359 RepID=A0A916SKH6_9HYPH|nr:hypothetical protein [Brucella endophytica]GGB03667.1 hypothetical protein GCM10011491_34800 [Brucella endophytica]